LSGRTFRTLPTDGKRTARPRRRVDFTDEPADLKLRLKQPEQADRET